MTYYLLIPLTCLLIQSNPDNALILKKWDGDNTDRTLIGLAQLLHEIKESGIEDVRDVLTYYRQFEDPVEAFRWGTVSMERVIGVAESKVAQVLEQRGLSKLVSEVEALARGKNWLRRKRLYPEKVLAPEITIGLGAVK